MSVRMEKSVLLVLTCCMLLVGCSSDQSQTDNEVSVGNNEILDEIDRTIAWNEALKNGTPLNRDMVPAGERTIEMYTYWVMSGEATLGDMKRQDPNLFSSLDETEIGDFVVGYRDWNNVPESMRRETLFLEVLRNINMEPYTLTKSALGFDVSGKVIEAYLDAGGKSACSYHRESGGRKLWIPEELLTREVKGEFLRRNPVNALCMGYDEIFEAVASGEIPLGSVREDLIDFDMALAGVLRRPESLKDVPFNLRMEKDCAVTKAAASATYTYRENSDVRDSTPMSCLLR